MGEAVCVDSRRRVVEAVDGGLSHRRAAERFGVGVSSAVRWVARCKRSGHLEPGKRGGDRRCHRIDGHRDRILALIEDQPDLCLGESAERLDAETGYRALPSVVCRFFQRHGIRRKKGRRMGTLFFKCKY